MYKYNIEGNINFFDELYSSLDIDETNQKTDEDNNLCLITNQPLTENFVKMICGHKFNYIALFNDIKNHKQKFNSMEGNSTHLKTNEIRCPYCRCKQTGVLPYYEELGLKKINGVNSYDPTIKQQTSGYNKKTCEYLTPNKEFDPSGNTIFEFAPQYSGLNCKFFTCNHTAYYKMTNLIEGYTGTINSVCHIHKNKIISDNKKELKEKAKIEAKKVKEEAKKAKEEAKIKAKDEAKKVKEEAKQKAKEDKKNKVKTTIENVVLGPTVILNPTHTECLEVLKSGPNKGKQCGSKVYDSCYCKRHIKNEEKSNDA
jgi:hypothetical protein